MYRKLKQMYESLYDDLSKRNFINRLSNNLTSDGTYLVNLISENCKASKEINIAEYYRNIANANEKKLIVYGAGELGKTRYNFNKYLKLDDIYCFCDKNADKQQAGFYGKKVISPEELVTSYKDYYLLIESKYYYQEIYDYLVSNGFNKENVIVHADTGVQYFDYEYMAFTDEEVMVDGGCFDCETIEIFKSQVKKYKKIYAFEPDGTNYEKCKSVIDKLGLEDVEMVNAGLWSETTTLSFSSGNGSSSRIIENDDNSEKVEVCAIDDVCKEPVTFIKMDIEGAELEALRGAKQTIINNKPKLAICLYHKNEDILDIQEYLMELVPEYRFGIRHYTDHSFETVLYAFIEERDCI